MGLADSPLIFGHRGAAGLLPENTLPGFAKAIELGVSGIELDVYCVDGVLVVIHDDTFDRTTSGTGRVQDAELSHLRTLDAGAGAQIPLLEEVFALVPTGVAVNIELKGPGTAQPTAEFLKAHGDSDVLVSSFDHKELGRFRQKNSQTRVAPLFSRWPRNPWKVAEELDAWSINLSKRSVDPAIFATAREKGLRSLVYTINDLKEARWTLELGATGLFTDYPDSLTRSALTV